MSSHSRATRYSCKSGSNLIYLSYVCYCWFWFCTLSIFGILAQNQGPCLHKKNFCFWPLNMIKLSRSKIYLAISLLHAVVLIGVLGYRFIAGYTWTDALYMTVITMATVGFKEVHPLDDTAKIFTVFLNFR